MPDTSIPRTVLYAEDDPNDAFFMRHAFGKLTDAGVTLKIVSDGREAIDYLSGAGGYGDRVEHPLPMLLFLDVKMPQRSGLEVLAWVRSRPEFASLPVLMFSSSTQETDIAFSRRLGANAYFVKPSNAIHLHVLIKEVLAVLDAGLPADGQFPLQENLLRLKSYPPR